MIKLSKSEKAILSHIANSAPKHLARRATIILMSDSEAPTLNIAQETETSLRTVQRWQNRFTSERLAIFPQQTLETVSTDGSPIEEPPDDLPMDEPPPPPEKKPKPKKRKKNNSSIEHPVRKKVGLTPTDSLAEAGRKVLSFHFARMLQHEPGTRQGEDIEALHDMRVATRRMRAALDIFRPGFKKKIVSRLNKRLKATGRALGRVRDLDVFIEHLQQYRQTLPDEQQAAMDSIIQVWQTRREERREKMLAYLDSNKYEDCKQTLLEFVTDPTLGAKSIATDQPIPYQVGHIGPRLIYTRYEMLRAYETVLDNASLEVLHELRIVTKGFRYLLEYFWEILGPEKEPVIQEVKQLQDHLGDLNDADIASAIIRDFLAEWEQHQFHLPLAERQSPAPMVAYLNYRLNQRHHLIVTFPRAWQSFNRPEVRRNLALAIANL